MIQGATRSGFYYMFFFPGWQILCYLIETVISCKQKTTESLSLAPDNIFPKILLWLSSDAKFDSVPGFTTCFFMFFWDVIMHEPYTASVTFRFMSMGNTSFLGWGLNLGATAESHLGKHHTSTQMTTLVSSSCCYIAVQQNIEYIENMKKKMSIDVYRLSSCNN